ncbi:MAG: M23 family metallopeptidase [Candidatus Sigynarchaeota archaeon]
MFDWTWLIIFGAICGLVLVYMLCRRWIKTSWKRKALGAVVLVLSVGILLAGWHATESMFDTGGRYDPSRFPMVEAPFENATDIRDFRNGFSGSASCPLGYSHPGVDFFLKNGTKMLAASPGQVYELKVDDNGEGAFIRYYIRIYIRYNTSICILYSLELKTTDYANITRQLSLIKVKVGDWVSAGQELGRFFNCGGDPDHLDWGISDNHQRVCPQRFFTLPGYEKMMDLVHAFHPTWNLCYP